MVSKLQRSPSWLSSTSLIAFARDVHHLSRIDEQDARLRVEEAADQPGAGDAVDLWPPPCDPNAGTLRRQAVELGLGDERQTGFRPGFVAAFQHARVEAVGAQLRDRRLAHFVTGLAGGHDRPGAIKFGRPRLCLAGIAPERARQQLR